MKEIFKYIIVTICVFILYFIVVSVAPKFSAPSMYKNLEASVVRLTKEGIYSSPFENGNLYDNWTDSYYLNIIYHHGKSGDSPFVEGLANYYYRSDNGVDTVVDDLENALSCEVDYELTSYPNYWLGIILLLKILLCFFNLSELRYILYVFAAALHGVVIYKLWKNINFNSAIAYALACVMFCVNYQASCLASCVDFIIEPIAMIYFVSNHNKKINPYAYFLIGSLQVYLSFLYAPIRVVAMLLVFSVILSEKEGRTKKERISELVSISVLWTLGYGLTNLLKQILVKMFLKSNLGFEKMSAWSDSNIQEKITAYETPLANVYTRNVWFVLIALIVLVFVLYKTNKIKIEYTKDMIITSFCAILAGFIPVWIWCFVLSEAVGHGFYNQNYMPYIVALLYLLVCGVKIDNVDGE